MTIGVPLRGGQGGRGGLRRTGQYLSANRTRKGSQPERSLCQEWEAEELLCSSFPGSAWERRFARLCLASGFLGRDTNSRDGPSRDGVPRQSLGTRRHPRPILVTVSVSCFFW